MAQKILITEEIVPAGIEILKEKGYEVDCKFDLSREELLDIIEDYDAPVSYTHLDVYKRQRSCLRSSSPSKVVPSRR